MQNIPKNMFEPASANAGDAEKINKKSLSLWKDAMLRFRSNKLTISMEKAQNHRGLGFLLFFSLLVNHTGEDNKYDGQNRQRHLYNAVFCHEK